MDPEVARAIESLAAAQAAYLAATDPWAIGFRVGTGDAKVALPESNAALQASPGVSLTSGFGTSISFALDLSISSNEARFLPRLEFSQSLDEVLGLAPVDADELEARYALVSAEAGLAKARTQARAKAVRAIEAAAVARRALASAQATLEDAEKTLADAKALRTYAEGSAALVALESAVAGAKASRAYSTSYLARKEEAALRLTGAASSRYPAPVAVDDAAYIAAADEDSFLSVRQAIAALEAATARADETIGSDRLSLSIQGGARRTAASGVDADGTDWFALATATYGGFSGSLGGGWSESGSGYPFVSFAIAYASEPASSEDALAAQAERDLRSAESALGLARIAARDLIASWYEALDGRDRDELSLRAQAAKAGAAYAEAVSRQAAGLATDHEVRRSFWAVEDARLGLEALAWARIAAAIEASGAAGAMPSFEGADD